MVDAQGQWAECLAKTDGLRFKRVGPLGVIGHDLKLVFRAHLRFIKVSRTILFHPMKPHNARTNPARYEAFNLQTIF